MSVQEAVTSENFDEESYRTGLIDQGYTETAAREKTAKRKEELSKNENENNFEYVLKIETVTDNEDLIIAGIATTEKMDHDSEIVDLESVKSVWKSYMENPVIRFLHGKDSRNPDAIGTVIPEYTDSKGKTWKTEITDKGPFIVAKISNAPDTESIRTKIKEGILKGFSIGGRAQRVKEFSHKLGKDINRVITKRISEVSVVDLPANSDSFFNVIKSCTGDACYVNDTREAKDVVENITEDVESTPTECVESVKCVENTPVNIVEKLEAKPMEDEKMVELEIPELTDFIKQVVTDMTTDQDRVEKEEDYDRIKAENGDLKKKIEELESKSKAKPKDEDEDKDEDKADKSESDVNALDKIEKLEADLKEMKETPMYKALQEDPADTMEKTETTSHLSNVISAHFGGN